MLKRKEEKGITLIALIITIIILLILAGITINLALSPDGIVEKAQTAKDEYARKQDKEIAGIGELENVLNRISDEIEGKKPDEDKLLTTLFKNGQNCEVEDCNNPNHLHVGDYLDYKNPTYTNPEEGKYTAKAEKTGMDRAGESFQDQTFDVANNQDMKWRVLGLSKDGNNLLLVSEKPIKSDREKTDNDPYFYMYGANAYEYGITELNNICAKFKNSTYAEEVRSITMEDINEVLGIKTEEDIKRYNAFPVMNSGAKQYGETYEFEGQYTPAKWLEEQKAIVTRPEAEGTYKGLVTGKVDGYVYMINVPDEYLSMVPGLQTVKPNTKLTELLFSNVEYGTNPFGAPYWLASRGVDAGSGGAYFGLGTLRTEGGITGAEVDGMFYSDRGYEYVYGFGVRPVVVLKSNITVNSLQKLDGVEEAPDWSYGGLRR